MWPVIDPWVTAWAYADALVVPRAGVAAWQARAGQRLEILLEHAARASPLYRALARRAPGGRLCLADLPPMRKATLMRRFDDWVTDPALHLREVHAHLADPHQRHEPLRGRYMVWTSSGSRGEPGVFVQDAQALAVADALEAARGPVTLDGLAARPMRLAYVGATEGPYAGIVTLRRTTRLLPGLGAVTRAFSFLQPLPELVARLNEAQPTVLSTYPSMAYVLAEAQAEGRLHLRLDALWTGGETLTPMLRTLLQARFGAPVRDMYGASECLSLASEGRCGHLHLNADWALLEPVDARGRPVPEGTVGHTAWLTQWSNRVQPVLRIDLGDRVRTVPGPCACGSALPVIEVEGRSGDVLTLRDARGHALPLSPLALATVLEDEGGVFDFDLHQGRDGALQLTLHGAAAGHRRQAGRALRDWLARQGAVGVRLATRTTRAPGPRGASGKRARIQPAPPA